LFYFYCDKHIKLYDEAIDELVHHMFEHFLQIKFISCCLMTSWNHEETVYLLL